MATTKEEDDTDENFSEEKQISKLQQYRTETSCCKKEIFNFSLF